MTFARALAFVLQWEGGYAEVPGDRGGATNRGITQATYDAWSTAVGLPAREVYGITGDEVSAIYLCRYWLRSWCERMPGPVALALLDGAVHSGPAQSVRWLQRALGVTVDGLIGPQTLAAAKREDADEIAAEMIGYREAFLVHLATRPEQAQFLRGWLARIAALRTAVSLP